MFGRRLSTWLRVELQHDAIANTSVTRTEGVLQTAEREVARGYGYSASTVTSDLSLVVPRTSDHDADAHHRPEGAVEGPDLPEVPRALAARDEDRLARGDSSLLYS